MSNRRNIADALSKSSGSKRMTQAEAVGQGATRAEASPSQPQQDAQAVENPHYRPSRAGKSNVTGYFPPEVKKQLRLIAAEEDKTIQQLLGEGLNMLFVKYGRAEIAPTERE